MAHSRGRRLCATPARACQLRPARACRYLVLVRVPVSPAWSARSCPCLAGHAAPSVVSRAADAVAASCPSPSRRRLSAALPASGMHSLSAALPACAPLACLRASCLPAPCGRTACASHAGCLVVSWRLSQQPCLDPARHEATALVPSYLVDTSRSFCVTHAAQGPAAPEYTPPCQCRSRPRCLLKLEGPAPQPPFGYSWAPQAARRLD